MCSGSMGLAHRHRTFKWAVFKQMQRISSTSSRSGGRMDPTNDLSGELA